LLCNDIDNDDDYDDDDDDDNNNNNNNNTSILVMPLKYVVSYSKAEVIIIM